MYQEIKTEKQSRYVYYKDGPMGVLWTWDDSLKQNVWGVASSKKKMAQRATRMFPGDKIILIRI